ncbi:ATP-binding cassette domain-containing protein [Micromonospora sp. NPDC048868]|uniref:ATP-binding cassette domain-containing protein n=1 Tax=Micromonospora sp. NPDC048868 TaxID=3364258 RepID=UPI00371EEE42
MKTSPRGRRHPLWAAIGLSLEADRRSTVLTFLSFGLRPAIPIVIAYLLKVVIDAAVAGDGSTVLVTAVGIAAAAALSFGSVSWAIELNTKMIEATSALIDERLIRLTSRLPGVGHMDRPEVLDRLEVLRQERVHLSEGADAFALVLGAAVRAVVTAVVLAMLNPVMLLAPLLAIPALVASRRGHRRRGAAVAAAAADARLAQHLFQTGSAVSSGKELRLTGAADEVRARYERVAAAADAPVTRTVWRNVLPTALAGAFFAVGYLGALQLVLRQYTASHTSLGEVVLTLSLVTWISLQVAQAVAFLGFLQETVDASRNLLAFEDYVAGAVGAVGGRQEPPERLVTGMRLEGVSFQYPGGERPALRNVTLDLPAGSVVAVVGANGAGKSTLIKLLSGLLEPAEGRVLADDVDLALTRPGSWYTRTSACFQDFVRFEFTAALSVGLGSLPHRDDHDRVATAVRDGAAEQVMASLPQGPATPLGRSFADGAELSGGQWQRIALARGRMRQTPCLLVLDEPTAAIDPLAEDEILSRYIAAARATVERTNGITLFASHRMSTARAADLIIVIADGEVVEVGDHATLTERPDGIYRDLYDRQARAYA